MVAGVPAALAVWGLIQYSLGYQQILPVFFFFAIYVILMAGHPAPSPDRFKSVDWTGLPNDIISMVTTTTNKGDYLHLELITTFEAQDRLSQSDLTDRVLHLGIDTTRTTVRDYIKELEDAELISTPPMAATQAKQYALTARGTWCQVALGIILPRTYYGFYLHNYLGLRRIPKEPISRATNS